MAKVRLESLKCQSCGAPLKLPRRIRASTVVTCEYCGQSYNVRELIEATEGEREDIGEEAIEKPYGSKIKLERTHIPFTRLVIDIPPPGFLKALPIFIFASFWCGFMVVWNAIAISQGQVMMALFGLLHDLVGLVLIAVVLRVWFGKEHVEVDSQFFRRTLDVLGFKRQKAVPTQEIDRVGIKISFTKNGVKKKLVVGAGTKEVTVADTADDAELRWLSYEIRKFIEEQTGRKVRTVRSSAPSVSLPSLGSF